MLLRPARGLRSKVSTKRTKNKRAKGRPVVPGAKGFPEKGWPVFQKALACVLTIQRTDAPRRLCEPKFAGDLDCQVHASKIILLARPFVPINVHRMHNAPHCLALRRREHTREYLRISATIARVIRLWYIWFLAWKRK